MKIAMPKNGEVLNQHFGKSKSFAIAIIEENEVKEINEVSTESLQHNHEGIADFFERQKINVIITGGIGKGAYNPLIQRGFKIVRGASGTIEEVLKLYLDGQLQDKNVICNHHHEHH